MKWLTVIGSQSTDTAGVIMSYLTTTFDQVCKRYFVEMEKTGAAKEVDELAKLLQLTTELGRGETSSMFRVR